MCERQLACPAHLLCLGQKHQELHCWQKKLAGLRNHHLQCGLRWWAGVGHWGAAGWGYPWLPPALQPVSTVYKLVYHIQSYGAQFTLCLLIPEGIACSAQNLPRCCMQYANMTIILHGNRRQAVQRLWVIVHMEDNKIEWSEFQWEAAERGDVMCLHMPKVGSGPWLVRTCIHLLAGLLGSAAGL